jgi:DNA repair exonuclease SbcCD ATPase subunit
MFEGDKEKYKKFLKNLENALAEADIQKRIREIVRDTKGLAAIDAVEADKQNEHDFEKNKKIKKSFDEQAQRIAELQEENDEQAASIKALKRAKEQQEHENNKLAEQVKNQTWELAQKNEELRSAAAVARKFEQDYEKINEANAKLQRELNAWQKEFAEPAKFYRLYKSLPQGIRGRFTDIIADSSIVAFISTGSNIEYVEMFWDSMKRNYAELGAEREALLQIFAYLLELCNAYQGEQVYELLDDEIGKGFDDDVHMRSENCSKYSGKIEKVLLPGIWNKRSERANKKALVEWQ